MDNIARVTRHAARQLWRAPLVSAASILTLAIGIGACALMMSIISTVLLKPLPYGDPDRLVMSWGWYPNANLGFPEQPTHGAVFSIMRDNTQAFAALAAFRAASFNLGDSTSAERLDGIQATGDFFAVLGVPPQIGHFFERANETPGVDRVAVLSDAVWRRRFGADPHILGRTLTLNAEPYTVIGVARAGFAFPRGPEMPADFQFATTPDLWVPLEPPKGGVADLAIVGRLRPGVSMPAAREDMDRVMAVVQRSIPVIKSSRPGELLVSLRQQVVGDVQTMLASLLAAVLLVLMIACVNTAQLVLAQRHGRRRDLAIRAALGSSTGRLAGDVLAEIALLVSAGGVAGMAAGIAGLKLLRAYGSTRLPRAPELSFDARSAFAALGAIALAAILVSVIPLLVDRRRPLVELLRAGGRGVARGGLHLRVRRALIVGELAGSLILVTCAGLLVRSLSLQLEARRGFDAVRGLTFEVSLPPGTYPERPFATGMDHAAAVRFLEASLDNIRALPGVSAAGIGKPLPLSGAQQATVFTPEGKLPALLPGALSPIAQFTVASPHMLGALGATVLAGRDFSAADRAESLPVVIVNEAMANWIWPGTSALGKRIRVGRPDDRRIWPWMTVVGVVSNMKRYTLTESPRPEMIVPYTQNPYLTFGTMQFVVRSNLETSAAIRAIQRAIASVDPGIPIARVRTIDDLVATSASNARFATFFMASFGIVALVLTIVGVYGIIGYGVVQRRQEFGVRRALGARPRDVLWLIVHEGVNLGAAGVAAGLALTAAAAFGLRHLLFGISPFDPVTLVTSIAVVVAVTAAASIIPAAAAARIEPRAALEE
ncbi:MAG TPA: ADOP family duplicated permease [Gemmatimonadaceae bacterium]|nr:ADOP family duplicated permease [Gemmatimonadaceae bacterium]